MDHKETAKNNLLIAEFMGAELETTCKYNTAEDDVPKPEYRYNHFKKQSWQHHVLFGIKPQTGLIKIPEEMEFHSSWDWLMPVFLKCDEFIEPLGEDFENDSWADRLSNSLLTCNIEICFSTIVEFIQWINTKIIDMKPSNFINYPCSSALGKSEAETVALNIMKILKRTGDKFRDLDWEEYKKERLKDNHFLEGEKPWFDKVISYCKSADTAKLFSPDWNK